MSGWQDIASAPRDGTWLILFDGRDVFPAYYGCVGRYTNSPKMWIGHQHGAMPDDDIVSWQHFPDAPTTPSTEGQGA